jgi:AcrR family transcriptional regulator
MRTRLDPKQRRARILDAAVGVALDHGYLSMSREAVAKRAQCSPALVSKYLGTMVNLRRAVMRAAVASNHRKIIADGVSVGDRIAMQAAPGARK